MPVKKLNLRKTHKQMKKHDAPVAVLSKIGKVLLVLVRGKKDKEKVLAALNEMYGVTLK